MLGIINLPLFIGAVLLLNVTPGPDTAYIVGRSVTQGRGAGVVSALGISAGCVVHTLACAFGLTALLAASTSAFVVIKIVGAAYLVYLGVRLIVARPSASAAAAVVRSPESRPLPRLFAQGFVTNVLNPKVVLFFVSFFPQFVDAGSPHKTSAFLVLGLVFIAMSTVWNSFVAWIAGSVSRRFAGRLGLKRWLDRCVGAAFVGLGLKLATAQR